MNTEITTIDGYIAGFPEETRQALQQMRAAIQRVAPEATEAIKYAIPTFVLKGKNLCHFGGFTHHVGFYPTPVGVEEFAEELSAYKQGKGSVQFPLSQPMPLGLVERIVRFRLESLSVGKAGKRS